MKTLESGYLLFRVSWDKLITGILLGLILLFGIIIRLYNLGANNLWYDEFLSYYFAKFMPIMNLTLFDFHPPFYFILLRLWMKCFGCSELALRSLSMIFGVVSIYIIYKLGRITFNQKIGLTSAFFLSISPIHIWYSQEARGYSLLIFLTIVSVYFFLSALKKKRAYKWAIFVLSSILALYTSYFFIFIIIILSALFFLKDFRPLLRHYLICLFAIIVAFVPFCPFFLKQISIISDAFWLPKPDLSSLRITFENFNMGYNSTTKINFFTFTISFLLFFISIFYWWKQRKKEIMLLILLIFIPIISIFLISQRFPIYLDRQLLLFSPFYYIIVSAGLEKIKKQIIKYFIYSSVFILALFCLSNYFTNRMPLSQKYHMGVLVKKSSKPAADYINNDLEEGDIIAISDKCVIDIFYYLMPHISSRQLVYFLIEGKFKEEKAPYNYKKLKHDQWFRLKHGLRSHIFELDGKPNIPGIRSMKELNYKRIWLISSSWSRDEKLGEHAKAVRQYMQVHYLPLSNTKNFGGILIDLYGQKTDGS